MIEYKAMSDKSNDKITKRFHRGCIKALKSHDRRLRRRMHKSAKHECLISERRMIQHMINVHEKEVYR